MKGKTKCTTFIVGVKFTILGNITCSKIAVCPFKVLLLVTMHHGNIYTEIYLMIFLSLPLWILPYGILWSCYLVLVFMYFV